MTTSWRLSRPLTLTTAALLLAAIAGCDDGDGPRLGQADGQTEPMWGDRDRTADLAQDQPRPAPPAEQGDRSLPAGMRRDRTAEGEQTTQRMGFPSNQQPVLLVERRGPAQVRAGEAMTYDVTITNASEEAMLHDVIVTESLLLVGDEQAAAAGDQDPDLSLPENVREARRFAREIRERAGQQQQQQQSDPALALPENVREATQFGREAQQQQQQDPQQQQQQQDPQQQGRQQAGSSQDAQRSWREGDMDLPSGMVQTWNIAMLAPGESLTFEGRLLPVDSGTVHVCTTATFQQAYCAPIEVVAPALGLRAMIVDEEGKRVGRILACDEVWLLYRVTNPGDAATPPVQVTQTLPEGVQLKGQQGQELQLDLDAIPPGESVERKVPLEFTREVTFEGEAVARSGELTARAAIPAVVVMKPELGFEVNGPARSYIGRPVTYSVEVINAGPAPVFDASVRMELSGAGRAAISTGNVREEDGTYQLGDLTPGEFRRFSVTAEPQQAGTVTARFAAEGYCVDAVTKDVVTQVVGVSALRLETIDLTDPVAVGDTAVYEVQVKNQGSAEDVDVRLTAKLPPQLRFIDGSGDTAVQGSGQQVQFAPVQRLAPGDVVTWRIRAQVLQAGQARLALEMTSKTNQQPIIEQEPTTLIERGQGGARGAERGGELEERD